MDISLILYGLAGLAALVIGAEVLVRGASSLAQRFGVSPLVVGLLVLAVSIACLPEFFSGHVIDRWEGAIFLFYYVAYATYLALAATAHSALEPFSVAMFAFVIPVTVLTLGIIFYRSYQRA